MKQGWRGLVAAPHTPFAADGALALDIVPEQLARLKADRVMGAFVCGSTGEGLSLSVRERMELAESWVRHRPDGFGIIVHVGAAALPDSIALASHAASIGADAIATLPPFYFKPGSVDALMGWLEPVAAAASGVPFHYYHLPALTGVDLPMVPFADAALKRIPRFAGIKYSKPDLFEYQELRTAFSDQLDLFWGVDEILLAAAAIGCTTAVGSTYNHSAALYLAMLADAEAGRMDLARERAAKAAAMVRAMVPGGVIANQKALLSARGLPLGPPRPPLTTVPAGQTERLLARFDSEGWWGR
jgi:N-acetylneuraminate lyase